MICRDGDAVELRHVLRGIAENVRNDPHRRFWRIYVGVADHELLQNVVLNGPAQLVLRNTLLFRRDDVKRQHRNDRAIHGHADRSEEHTSELQSLMRISYAVFCLNKKTKTKYKKLRHISTYTRKH